MINEDMTVEKKVYCRQEGEHSKRHLEGSKLNMASRPKWAVRRVESERKESGQADQERSRIGASQEPRDQQTVCPKCLRFYPDHRLGKGNPGPGLERFRVGGKNVYGEKCWEKQQGLSEPCPKFSWRPISFEDSHVIPVGLKPWVLLFSLLIARMTGKASSSESFYKA